MYKSHRNLLYIISTLLFIVCCNKNKDISIVTSNNTTEVLYYPRIDFGYNFVPSSMSFARSMSDSLRNEINTNRFFFENNTQMDSSICENIVIMMLKMYEYHLMNYYTSFELLDYNNNEVMLMLNKYFTVYNIDTTGFKQRFYSGEGYFSHIPYETLKNNERLVQNTEIKKILDHIKELETLVPL